MACAELEPKTVAERLRCINVSGPYAWQIAHGKRAPSRKLAVRIWREAGLKLGPLAGKTDDEIQVFARFVEDVA
jgi:hypothetical protein